MTAITAWGAASLRNMFTDPAFLAALATATNSQVTLNPPPTTPTKPPTQGFSSYDSSGYLAQLILNPQGVALPDVFVSAATDPMDDLVAAGKVASQYAKILRNSLVLIKKRSVALPVTIVNFGQVTAANTNGVGIYIANPASPDLVPAGIYAQQAFTYFGSAVANFAMGSNNTNGMTDVTKVLAAVGGASGPAIGVVYATDAVSSDVATNPQPPVPNSNLVEIIAVAPYSVNDDIIYPAAALTGLSSTQAAAAQAFVNFLASPAALPSFIKWGFIPYNPITP